VLVRAVFVLLGRVLQAGGTSNPLAAFAKATSLFANASAPFDKRCIQSSWADDVITPLMNVTFVGETPVCHAGLLAYPDLHLTT
jgi:hypothetical protein